MTPVLSVIRDSPQTAYDRAYRALWLMGIRNFGRRSRMYLRTAYFNLYRTN